MSARGAVCAVLVAGGCVVDAAAQDLQQLLARVEPSIVKVKCPDRNQAATGFVFGSPGQVVTALHVVDGSRNIVVHFPSAGVTRSASFDRVHADADLALLRVDDPPPVPALSHSPRTPGLDEDLHALGFALNMAAVNHFSFRLRYGSRKLRDNISAKAAASVRDNRYPSLELEVLKLGGESLLPGLSGAPLFDREGRVVGVGDGGLEQGAINISWGIPAAQLDRLLQSSSRTGPGSGAVRELFSAELDANLDATKTISAPGVELFRVRTRRFDELVETADDQLGVAQLSAVLGFDQPNFVYDIYQDARSGATIVVPEGAKIERSGAIWKIHFPETAFDRMLGERRLELLLTVQPVDSDLAAQQRSVDFENRFLAMAPGSQWQLDPMWSYAAPVVRWDGLTVNRKAAGSYRFGSFGPESEKYLFQTLAFRRDVFLGYAIINHDNTPGTIQGEMACSTGLLDGPECEALFASRRDWARGVLGVMLSGFSL